MKSLRIADRQLREDAAVFELPRSFFYLDNLQQEEYIRSAFKQLCRQHPDKGGDSEAFRKVIEARNRLNSYIDEHNGISIHDVYNAYLIDREITAEQFINGRYRLRYIVETTIDGNVVGKNKSRTVVIDGSAHIIVGGSTFHYFQDNDSDFGDIYFVRYPHKIVSYNSRLYYGLRIEITQDDVKNKGIDIHGIAVKFNSDTIRKHNQIIDISKFRALFITIVPVIKIDG